MATVPLLTHRRGRALLAAVLGTRTAAVPADLALVAGRTALAWIFIYYGAGKLFGWFNGPGIHRTALYFSNTAHLHPGGLFAVLGGVIEFGGGIALALGLGTRLAGLALFGDMVMAMITVTWATGINSADVASRLPIEHGARRPGPSHCRDWRRPVQHRRVSSSDTSCRRRHPVSDERRGRALAVTE